MNKPEFSSPVRVVLVYVVFGVLWILLSDRALEFILQDEQHKYTLYQTLKGSLFVLLSAVLIYVLQRRDMRALADSERQYKPLFKDSPQPMWVYDVETLRFLAVNDAAVHAYGYSREEFLGMTLKEIRPAEDVPALMNSIASHDILQRSGGWRHRKKDGALIDVEITSHSTKFNGRFARLVLAHDVTERKHAEEALKVSEENYRSLAETSDSAIAVFNNDGRILYANPTSIRIWDDPQLIGKTIHDLYPADVADRYLAVARKVINEQIVDLNELESVVKGRRMWFRASMRPIRHDDGSVNALLLNALDITDRKNMEEELRKSEARYRSTLDNMLEGCQIIGFDWTYTYINDAAARHGRSAREALLHRTMMEAYPGIDETEFFAVLRDCMKNRTARQMENIFTYPDGSHGCFEFSIEPVPEGLFVLSIDITERKQAEAQLRESEYRFRLLVENIEEGFWITDPVNQRGIYFSDGNERIWGRSLADLTQEWGAFMESVLPEDRPLVQANIEKQLRGEHTSMEYRIHHPDGSLHWLWDRAFPILNDSGEVDIVTGLVTDITERKQAEMEIQKQIKRMSVLSAIDRMINSSVDLTLTMNVFLMEITIQLEVDAARIHLYNPHLQMLELVMQRGFLKQGESHHQRLGEGLAGQVVQSRREVIIPNLGDLETPPKHAPTYVSEGFVSYFGIPLIAKGQVKGVLEIFHRAELSPDREWFDYMMTLAGQAAIAIDNIQLFQNLQSSNYELVMAYDATIAGWSRAMDLRDQETEGHTLRVTEMALQLAERMGVSKQDLIHVKRGALLHDIGKLGVPDHILRKPGALTDEEWVKMREHPTHAYHMLLPIEYLRPALDIPYCHHEKWDGSGYPRRLKGEEIPFTARIFAVVDVWDALRSDRPYRDGWSAQETRDYILAESGKHFDPHVVEAFLKLLEDHPEFH